MTTPTDGEWMSAHEALEFLTSLGMNYVDAVNTICTRAHAGLVKARAKVFIKNAERQSNADVPPEFWWARGDKGLEQNWDVGDFSAMVPDFSGQFQAFGVEFRQQDIEQLRPKSSAKPPTQAAGIGPLNSRQHPLSPSRPSDFLVPVEQRTEEASPPEPVPSRKVFIVHGRDENAKNEVALFLKNIGLEDIVLHQRPNRGRHLLTKFQEEAADVLFAVVLMTPDDDGGLVGKEQQKRARQNVVFELGFFIGKFGAPRVAALIVPGVEKPSDFDGICWIDFGRGTNWKNLLARELKEAGIPFDSDAILNT